MQRGKKLLIAGVAAGVLVGGGYGVAKHMAETRIRQQIDAFLTENGAIDAVKYGQVSADPFRKGAVVRDITVTEEGVVTWRADSVEVADLKTDDKGGPLSLVGHLRGLHLTFAQWVSDCKEKQAACDYVEDAQDMVDQGIDELLLDMDLDYRMDEAAKRMRLRANLNLHDFMEVGLKAEIGGLNNQILRESGEWLDQAGQVGIPPAMMVMAFGATVGKKIDRIEIGNLGVAVTDHGGVRHRVKVQAKANGDTRPVDDILREEIASVQADIRANPGGQLPPALVEQMAKALEPFAMQGKPYRVVTTAKEPVVVVQNGPNGLELGPAFDTPLTIIDALAPQIGNEPL